MTLTTCSTSTRTSSRTHRAALLPVEGAGRAAGEVVRLVLDAVNRRDGDALVDLVHPDVEFFPILAALEGPVYTGHQGVRRWLRSLELDWEVFETRLDRVHDFGDSALGEGGWHARGRTSGVLLDSQGGAWLARVRDGRVTWWRTYTDRAEALATAPLRTAAGSGRSPTGRPGRATP